MRSYSDMLRDETLLSSVGSQSNPEVAKARALLIRAMVGPSWSDRSCVGKGVALLGHALLWVVLAVCTAFFAGFGLLVVGVQRFDVGGPSCRGACEEASFVSIIRTSVLMGMIGGGCVVGSFAWQRKREITRLRSLSHSGVLREYERWRARQDAVEAQEQREADLDYLARRTAEHLQQPWVAR